VEANGYEIGPGADLTERTTTPVAAGMAAYSKVTPAATGSNPFGQVVPFIKTGI